MTNFAQGGKTSSPAVGSPALGLSSKQDSHLGSKKQVDFKIPQIPEPSVEVTTSNRKNSNFYYSAIERFDKDHKYYNVSIKRNLYFEERQMYNEKMKEVRRKAQIEADTSLGLLSREDLNTNILDEFITSPDPHPENSLLQAFSEGLPMPYESDKGFKFNGAWHPAKSFLREDAARCMATMDPRMTKSSDNLLGLLDYNNRRNKKP